MPAASSNRVSSATSADPADRDKSPGDGKLAGFGKIGGRQVAVVSNDFTVFGASSGATNGKKIAHMKRVATQRGLPLVFLGESSGARMPDHMGSRGMGTLLGNDGAQYQRLRETPWVVGDPGSLLRLGFVVCGPLRLQRDAQGRGACRVERAAHLSRDTRSRRSRGTGRLAAPRRGDGIRRPGRRHRRGGDRGHQAFPRLPAQPPQRGAARSARACGLRRADGRHPGSAAIEPHPGLRRAQDHPHRRGRRQLLRAEGALRQGRGDGARATRRAHRGHRRQQPALQGRRAGHRSLREDDQLHRAVRLVQHPARPLRRHAGIRDRHRRRAQARARQDHELHERAGAGHGAQALGDPAQELRAGLPQHGRRAGTPTRSRPGPPPR